MLVCQSSVVEFQLPGQMIPSVLLVLEDVATNPVRYVCRIRVKKRRRTVNREQKQELVSELHGLFGEVSTVVVAHYSGLTVADLEALRKQMRAVGASFRVTKNRLTRIALEGTKFDGLSSLLTGPTGMAVSADPVAAAKAMVEFAKTNPKLIILGGVMDGNALNVDGVKALASLPSLDELRAKLVGMLQTPATRVATVLSQPGAGVARVLSAYATKGEAA